MSIIIHHCDEAQRAAKDKKGRRSETHYTQSHKNSRENTNGPMDALRLYSVALKR